MRLTLVIHSLQGGGAERVMSIMANYWAAASWEVTLLTFDDGSVPPFYDLDSRVHHIPLGIASASSNVLVALQNNLSRARALRRAICATHPDAVLSFMDKTNVLTLIATRGLNIPVVVSGRSDPAMNYPGPAWARLRMWTYPMADSIVLQSKGAMDYFPAKIQARSRIIPNPVLQPPANATRSVNKADGMLVLAVGRMVEAKGFDNLLKAFAQVKEKNKHWKLMILGDGPLRKQLEALSDSLGLEGIALMPGHVKNPYEYLAKADLFVMSSRFEGFPNALCEAMATGLPVISTDCPSGPREIIRHGVDGLLIPNLDAHALASAMDRLMSNDIERKRLASRAPEVTERFALDLVMSMWEEALAQAARIPLSKIKTPKSVTEFQVPALAATEPPLARNSKN